MNKYIYLFLAGIFCIACTNSTENQTSNNNQTHVGNKKFTKAHIQKLLDEGYKILEFVDPKTKDTLLMQQYFMAFLKKGKDTLQNPKTGDSLQRLHLAHLQKMYDLGHADISGPFGELDGNIRGVTIYNVPTLEIADSLANADPSVKAGRLEIEMHPWWAAKGYYLR
ncbi:YciI-like protein [Kordia sp. SMS9]|uniref:YciI family protein n=1 Tax=Kordia sp. SMS9 TaxID=2282170 RepID=UPI000E0E076D|nr:YciI family protein [Kordia sp. SMS9]AXG68769.1 YciI-like protein [Kordia sp. SMS9]